MHQDAIDLVVPNLKKLLEMDGLEEAITLLKSEIAPISDKLETQVIIISGDLTKLTADYNSNSLTDEQHNVGRSKIKKRILGIIGMIPTALETIKLTNSFRSIYTTTSEADLEKIQGPTNTLVPMSWVYKAIEVSKSVCQVIRADGTKGTGWLLEGGWMLTNHHVLPNKDFVRTTEIVFDYEGDLHGTDRKTAKFRLDADTAIFSNLLKLDYAYVKVIDNQDNTLQSWGHLELNKLKEPQIGDFVNIIQHPLGQKTKQIALTRNDVIALDNNKLFYRTDTEKGSSGAPVFDEEWDVIALHHAGKTEEDGGLQINADTGERKGANEGILIKDVMADIEKQLNALKVATDD